jgi:hypothetical protein
MSTKIHTAYKLVKAGDLWKLVHDIRTKARENVVAKLRDMYALHVPNVLPDSEAYKKKYEDTYKALSPEGRDKLTRLHISSKVLTRLYRISCTSLRRNPYNFDVSIAIREYGRSLYLIPYCDWTMKEVLDFLEEDPRLVDFHYQNQSDKPDHISEMDWYKRERVWHGMDKNGKWKDFLILDICSWNNFYELDPYHDLVREVLKDPAYRLV